jgi:hypothetical protein
VINSCGLNLKGIGFSKKSSNPQVSFWTYGAFRYFSSTCILARNLSFELINVAEFASRAAAERDSDVLKAKDLESKLKDLEERSKAALDTAEAKTCELHAQSVEREGSLTNWLDTLMETLASKCFDS